MKAFRVTSQSRRPSMACVHCGRVPDVGQIVVAHATPDGDYLNRRVLFHAACVEKLIAKVDGLSSQYDQLRERIIESGEPFPAEVVGLSG